MIQTLEMKRPFSMRAAVTSPRTAFAITPRGAFSLAESQRFLQGFAPLRGSIPAEEERLRFAFGLDGSYAPVAVSLRQDAAGVVHADVTGTADAAAARRQVERILSLEVDAAAYDALGERDPVLGELQRGRPGFRPVCFFSPYEAAVQAILGQRISIAQAATLRRRLIEEHGARVEIEGRTHGVLPHPTALLELRALAGAPEVKIARLQSLAEATLDGRLDASRLRALPMDEALRRLQELPGIGAWSAAHILLRGSGVADALPLAEPRILTAASIAYGRTLDAGDLSRIADGWRPYRMWASVLLVATHGFSAEARTMRDRFPRRGDRAARD